MSEKLSAQEVAESLRMVMNILKMHHEENVIAGVILTERSFLPMKILFGSQAEMFRPSGLDWDPSMENSFVIDGVLFLKGTQVQ